MNSSAASTATRCCISRTPNASAAAIASASCRRSPGSRPWSPARTMRGSRWPSRSSAGCSAPMRNTTPATGWCRPARRAVCRPAGTTAWSRTCPPQPTCPLAPAPRCRAASVLRAAEARAAAARPGRDPSTARLRLPRRPAGGGTAARPDRARRRAHHHQHRRGRRRRAREAPHAMGEPYRTLLGHFRHEIGHYYWDLLVRDGGRLDAFREVFGDEQPGLRRSAPGHYAYGPPADWQNAFVSAYASRTRGRISPRPGRTTCTSSTRSRPRTPSACASRPRWRSRRLGSAIDFDPHAQESISSRWSRPGCR